MTLAEIHNRLDRLESQIDEDLEREKVESARRVDKLRGFKSQVGALRVSLAAGREQIRADLHGEAA